MWLDGQAHKNHLTSIYNLHSSFISLMTSILTEEHFCSYRLQMCPTTRISNHIKCRLSHPKASDAHLLIFAGHCCNQQYDQLRNAYTHPHPRSQRFLFWSAPYRMLSKGLPLDALDSIFSFPSHLWSRHIMIMIVYYEQNDVIYGIPMLRAIVHQRTVVVNLCLVGWVSGLVMVGLMQSRESKACHL